MDNFDFKKFKIQQFQIHSFKNWTIKNCTGFSNELLILNERTPTSEKYTLVYPSILSEDTCRMKQLLILEINGLFLNFFEIFYSFKNGIAFMIWSLLSTITIIIHYDYVSDHQKPNPVRIFSSSILDWIKQRDNENEIQNE